MLFLAISSCLPLKTKQKVGEKPWRVFNTLSKKIAKHKPEISKYFVYVYF